MQSFPHIPCFAYIVLEKYKIIYNCTIKSELWESQINVPVLRCLAWPAGAELGCLASWHPSQSFASPRSMSGCFWKHCRLFSSCHCWRQCWGVIPRFLHVLWGKQLIILVGGRKCWHKDNEVTEIPPSWAWWLMVGTHEAFYYYFFKILEFWLWARLQMADPVTGSLPLWLTRIISQEKQPGALWRSGGFPVRGRQ